MSLDESESITCPVCGKGALRTIDFGDRQGRQVQTFTCGHEVEGATPVDATE